MLPSVSTSPLATKNQYQPKRYIAKPTSMLMHVHNPNRENRRQAYNRLSGSLDNLDDVKVVDHAIREISKVGTKNSGIGGKRLLEAKKALMGCVTVALQHKMNELSTLAPKMRADKIHEIHKMMGNMPSIPPEFGREARKFKADFRLVRARERAVTILVAAVDQVRVCREGTMFLNRHPSLPEPPGRRFVLNFDDIKEVCSLFKEFVGDAEVCATLCEVGRKWGEPYWADNLCIDERDVELLEERRDLMTRRGMEVVATETLHRHRNHPLVSARAATHAARLLGALNSKLLMKVAVSGLDSALVCETVVRAMSQLVKENRKDELARFGGRTLLTEYLSRYPSNVWLQIQAFGLRRALMKSKVKDESISNYKTDWAFADLKVAKQLFHSMDTDGSGKAKISEIRGLFKRMCMKMSDEDLKVAIAETDVNGNGTIEWEEFLYMVEKWGGIRNWSIESQFDEDKLADLRKLFDLFDADESGDIAGNELHLLLRDFGLQVTRQQVDEMIAVVDTDGSGSIDWYEFLFLMSKTCEQNNTTELHRRAFKFFESKTDPGNVNCIAFRNAISKLTSGSITEQDIDYILDYVNTASNTEDFNSLNYQEFVLLMTL
eukprot:GEMP01020186.1.p1 GENE.GEMP01020186.1~~GEMP01020186.1.p1  ORF type:complete len:606 (+),score=122.10 GEMP01020186.1:60-1877(+)